MGFIARHVVRNRVWETPYRRLSVTSRQCGTTLAVTGRVSVRWFGKWTVRSDEKVPLSFRGPSRTVMREVSVPGLDIISHVSNSCPDGRRRMSEVSSGAFTASLMVF